MSTQLRELVQQFKLEAENEKELELQKYS